MDNLNLTSEQLIKILRAEGVRPLKVEQIMEKVRNLDEHNKSTLNKEDIVLLSEYSICKPTNVALESVNVINVGDLKKFAIMNGSYALKDKIRAIGDSRYSELRRIFPWIADYEWIKKHPNLL